VCAIHLVPLACQLSFLDSRFAPIREAEDLYSMVIVDERDKVYRDGMCQTCMDIENGRARNHEESRTAVMDGRSCREKESPGVKH
jgi:hypothetical protein